MKTITITTEEYDKLKADVKQAEILLKKSAQWLGKMIADEGHLKSVLPNDCVSTLEQVNDFLKGYQS
jgi:hypothetical protein